MTEAFKDLLDRPIAFQRAFVRLGAGVTGALMLSQAIYWSKRTSDSDSWFYKTQADWEDETGLTRSEQEGARKKLVSLGVLQEKKQGLPCKLFFRVDFDRLFEALDSLVDQPKTTKINKQVCGKPANSDAENLQAPIYTETTQRIQSTVPASPKQDLSAKDANQKYESAFDVFYNAGLPKKGRKSAHSAFIRLAKKEKDVLDFAHKLQTDIRARLQSKEFGFSSLHPTTYLNQERWNDEKQSQSYQPSDYYDSV